MSMVLRAFDTRAINSSVACLFFACTPATAAFAPFHITEIVMDKMNGQAGLFQTCIPIFLTGIAGIQVPG